MIEDRVRELADDLDPRWGVDRVEDRLAALHRGLQARRRRRHAAIVIAALAVAAVALVLARTRPEPRTAAVQAVGQTITARAVATRLTPDAVVEVIDDDALRLTRGMAHFSVRRDPARRFRVEAGPVVVEVLGTAFTIERSDGRARVAVEHGVVRVSWPTGARVLGAGEADWFPPDAPPPAPPPPALTTAPIGRAPAPRPEPLDAGTPPAVVDAGLDEMPPPSTDELLRAADEARAAGRWPLAESLLERALAIEVTGTRAAAVAFSLAKVQRQQRHYAVAASTFARARGVDPDGALAEDALAHEARAWADAGRPADAAAAARRYLVQYPDGLHQTSVRPFAAP